MTPRWSRWLLQRVAPEERVEDLIGDIEEAHRLRLAKHSHLVAQLLTGVEAIDLAFAVMRHRVRRRWGLQGKRTLGLSVLDFKLGLRMLAKSPGLSIVSVIGMSVAIAIGAGAFEFIDSVMDPRLPLPAGDRIVSLQNNTRNLGNPQRRSLSDFIRWRSELKSVQELSAFWNVNRNMVTPSGAVHLVDVAEMTPSGFRVAGVQPLLGRYLLAEDEQLGASPVVVIAHEEWQRHFKGDRGVIGQQVQLGSVVRTVVGVMPEGFHFPVNHRYWVPMQLNRVPQQVGEGPEIRIFGRLAEGLTFETAQAELTTIGRRMAAAQPHTHKDLRPVIRPYTHPFTEIDTPAMLWVLRGFQIALSLLLIVVSVNVAILVYARTAARAGEITVRTALGASRARVVTQLFVEALVVSGIAAVIGVAIASRGLWLFVDFQSRASDNALPFWMDFTLSPRTIAYTVALALLGGAIVGVLPALKLTGRGLHDGLKQLSVRGAEIQLGRKWTALIIAQVAIAVAILPFAMVVAGKSVTRGTAQPGYAAHEILHTSLALEGEDPNVPENLEAYRRAYEARYLADGPELMRRLEAEPMVEAVTFANALPGLEDYGSVQLESTKDRRGVRVNDVAIDYFNGIGVPVIAGRGFVASDTVAGAQAVIVDRVFVDQVLKGSVALGRRVRQVTRKPGIEPAEFEEGPWLEIVGVVPSFAMQVDLETPDPRIYLPAPWRYNEGMALSIRVAGNGGPSAFADRLREVATEVNPDFKLYELRTGTEAARQLREAMLAIAIVVVGVVGSVLLLSIAGIYAMMSFTVVRRRREIGIRVALGADKWSVLRGIFARAAVQLGAGALAGLLIATALDQAVSDDALFGGDLRGLPILVLTIAAIGFIAAYGPARHALSVQPTEALRGD